jgi:hypothetical protein
MRLYHFLPSKYALDDLTKRRLKLSQIDKLNDPFELWCSDQSDRQMRAALRAWKQEMSKQYGLLCFCATWQNPLLWSHYAERHEGICLGFDVRDDSAARVDYVNERTPLQLPLTEGSMQRILFTKFSGWSYEEEWRAWFRLEERDPAAENHYFREFDQDIRLAEIIVGSLCTVEKSTLTEAIRGYSPQPHIMAARLAFKSFSIVEDKRGITSKS